MGSEQLRRDYVARVNRAIDHISRSLDQELSLERIAREACFSPFHFHRVFRAMVGETVSGYIRRLRLERAATMLLRYPETSVTEISLDCGFASPAAFARAFKERFGLSATEYRESKIGKAESKPGITDSNDGKAGPAPTSYLSLGDDERRAEMAMKLDVEVKEIPELHVAYVRNIGPYNTIGGAFETLCRWAGPRGLLGPGCQFLGVYNDDPQVTEPDKLRAEACVTVPPGTETAGEVGSMTIPGGRFAVARAEIGPEGFGEAWDALMAGWMPGSGYEPDDRLCYELYHQTPDKHPEAKFVLDLVMPVRPVGQ